MTLRIKGLEAGSQPTGLQAPHLDAVTRSLSHLSPFAAWSQSFVPGFLTLNPVDLSAQIIPFVGCPVHYGTLRTFLATTHKMPVAAP